MYSVLYALKIILDERFVIPAEYLRWIARNRFVVAHKCLFQSTLLPKADTLVIPTSSSKGAEF